MSEDLGTYSTQEMDTAIWSSTLVRSATQQGEIQALVFRIHCHQQQGGQLKRTFTLLNPMSNAWISIKERLETFYC